MEILIQPDSLSMVGSMNPFEIYSTKEVAFVLRDKATDKIIVQHTYTPNDNSRVTVKLKDIINPLLSFKVSDSSETYEQTNILKNFSVTVKEVDGTTEKTLDFSVIRAGVDQLADSAQNFLLSNFLTWQPNVKGVTYYCPEFLTYYAQEDCIAKCMMYFWNGVGYEEKEIVLSMLNGGKVWTIPVQYAIIAKHSSNDDLPSYYDVWVEKNDGTRLTYVQRYFAEDARSEEEEWFLFENSLGGIDCFRAYGNSENTVEHTHNVAEIEEDSEEYRVDTTIKYKKHTGYLGERERQWLLDFFPSLGKYHYCRQSLRKITVTESDVNYEAKELPTDYSFTYQYADARPYLNLSRTDVTLTEMHIHVPDIGNFTIAPRLVEFPRTTLSDGALFPVQNPYSEEWGSTTLASLYAQLVARLADGYKGGGGIGHTHNNFDLLDALTEFNAYVLLHGEKIKAGFSDQTDDFTENGPANGKILRKDREDVAQKAISFYEGLFIGVLKKWGITKEGLAKLAQLSVDGDSQLGENGTTSSFGNFQPGTTGARISVREDGTSTAEFDYITIRRAAEFREITIRELKHIGGELAISAAAMVCSKVETIDDYPITEEKTVKAFKCYFETSNNGEKKVYQQFEVGDQARCQQFDIEVSSEDGMKRTRYYWRLVIGVGDDYIVLSDADKDAGSTTEPKAGDNIVQLGYRYDDKPNRQSAMIFSATADDAPSAKYYQGINNYSLNHIIKDEGYDATKGTFHANVYGDSYMGDKDGNGYFSYDATSKTATFKGVAQFLSGSLLPDGETKLEDVTTKKDLENLNIRSGNLLRNTAFSGDYESADISESSEISEDKEMFSEKLKFWDIDGAVSIVDVEESMSGKVVGISNGGSLTQDFPQSLLDGESYTLSFKAKGGVVTFTMGDSQRLTQELTAEYKRYELHFTNKGSSNDYILIESDNATLCEIMLTYGTIAPAWSPAYADNDKSVAQFQNMKFLLDAITQGSTTVDGGLVMSQMFRVGNYRDGKMTQETGGMSGYYNDENSPYLWGGGSLEQAIHTIQKYKDNPTYQPSVEELEAMAKFVVTHGGRAILNDIILRGIIYAEGGVMKSIKSPNGNFEIDEEGNARLKGEIETSEGMIGGFKINSASIGTAVVKKDDGNNDGKYGIEQGEENKMSLNDEFIVFNGKDKQSILGQWKNYGTPLMMRMYDNVNELLPHYGAVISIYNKLGPACALSFGGGYTSGLALKTDVYHAGKTISRETNVAILMDTDCTYQLPDMQAYDDGHLLMLKRVNGGDKDNSVTIKVGKFYNSDDEEKTPYILHDHGQQSESLVLGSSCDAMTLIFSTKMATDEYTGCWLEFKNPRDW